MLGVRLRDLGSDPLTWADLATLIQYPCKGGALHDAIRGEHAPWTLEAELAAVIADRLGIIMWQLGGDENIPPPSPIHPGSKARHAESDEPLDEEDAFTMEELGAMLGIDQ
ncbi:MAG: hypothetical protein Q4D96_02885 [Propionibacteriaceae bacterium]|nr:hypothetical protein [Propionibacteriaceae bacterium]